MPKMELRHDLRMSLRQRLVLSPTVKQSLELLQLPSIDLEKLIETELGENPLLETASEDSPADDQAPADEQGSEAGETAEPAAPAADADEEPEPRRDDETEDHFEFLGDPDDYPAHGGGFQEEPWRPEPVEGLSLSEHLLLQVYDLRLGAGLEEAARYVIYSLDRHGLLSLSPEDLAAGWEGPQDLLDEAVGIVQGLEPTGIASWSAREAILAQLAERGHDEESLEHRLVSLHFDELPGRQYAKLAKQLGSSPRLVQEAMETIRGLNPYPGSEFAPDNNSVVVPDVFIQLVEGRYLALLNDSRFPQLVISRRNRRILESPSSPVEEKEYVREKYRRASHFLRSIDQRQQTVRRISEFLAEHQKSFFDNGTDSLRPLTLQNVADALGYNQSTISRAINGKYVQSPQGVHEMRFFFSRGLPDREDVSTRTVKEELRRIIEEEEHGAPLSDEQLTSMLKARGLSVKRRTVANYRTELGIPPAKMRKRY